MKFVDIVAIVFGLFVLSVFVMQAVLISRLTYLWLQSHLAGGKITVIELLGMTFRKVDRKLIVEAHVQAVQGGVDISVRELESAYLAGANVPRLVLAAVTQQKRGEDVDFDSLLAADLEDRLAEELGLSQRR